MTKSAKTSAVFLYLLVTSTLIDLQMVRSYRHTVTLTDKASSFVAYESFNSSWITRLSFKFKTYCLHCLLMYVDNTKKAANSRNYLVLTLLKGQLIVDLHRGSDFETLKKSLKMSRDLNDVQWHQIDIIISDKKSSISVDNESKTLVEDTIALSSLLYFGGVEYTAEIAANSRQVSYIQRFVGCIGGVTFTQRSGAEIPANEVKRNEATTGCLNSCTKMSCENNGKCLNRFTKTSCDCIGTGYEGLKCTREVTDAVFLNKTDYIGVSLRKKQGAFSVKMRFKTRNGEGLLLSTKKREKGFYVAVYNGNIRVSIDDKRGFFFGSGTLHDSQWHFLVVSVSISKIYIELDRKYNESRSISRNADVVNSPIFIGGLPDNDHVLAPTMPNNFIGCLQQVYVDDINIIYKLLRSYDSRITSTKTLKNKCEMRQESLQEALKRIQVEKKSKTTIPPTTEVTAREKKYLSNSSKRKPTNQASKDGKGTSYSKLAVENNKDLIAWISSGVVSGTIVLMIITACAIHYFKYKYENIFVSRMSEHEYSQEQQYTNNTNMHPKQQAVVFLQDKQVSKVVNL